MSRGKQEPKKRFIAELYEEETKKQELTDREVCRRIKDLHIVISKDVMYPDDPEKDNIVTCSPEHLTRIKRSGYISPSILNAICRVLGVAPEYLSGEISKADLDFFVGTPQYSFHEYQKFMDRTPEQKEESFRDELFDLHIYDRWTRMNNRQRSNCHQAIIQFADYLLSYMDQSEDGYNELFDFFSKTGVLMEPDPDLRKELFNTLKVTYKTFMQMHKK